MNRKPVLYGSIPYANKDKDLDQVFVQPTQSMRSSYMRKKLEIVNQYCSNQKQLLFFPSHKVMLLC